MANTNIHTKIDACLFPMLPSHPAAKGMARMAAAAAPAGEGHLVEYRSFTPKSLLNKSSSKRGLSLAYSINPYRGCEFGCRYCYARYTHDFLAPADDGGGGLGRDPEAFERKIFLKKEAAWLLEQELRKIDPHQEIALGTATDPYQPIERTAGITRSLLEVFARRTGYRLGVITKSNLIVRDRDLLRTISERNTLVVHLTITTADSALARLLEPRAPRPDLRFDAVRQLRAAGVRVGVLCSPLLPGITDTEASVDRVAALAEAADASFFAGEPLFLKPCSRPTYLSFVREHFPALEAEYAERFAKADFAARPYRLAMQAMIRGICARHGLAQRTTDALLTRDSGDAETEEAERRSAQGNLFGM